MHELTKKRNVELETELENLSLAGNINDKEGDDEPEEESKPNAKDGVDEYSTKTPTYLEDVISLPTKTFSATESSFKSLVSW